MSIGAPEYADKREITLTGTTTLVASDAYHQIMDPDGARTVVLPSGPNTQGGRVLISNIASGSEDITVQQSDASTTAAVISQGEAVELICNGTTTALSWQTPGPTET